MGIGVLSPWHIAIFALVVLVVFGPKRLPEMGRSLGKGMREFKESISGHAESGGEGVDAERTLLAEVAAEPVLADRDRLD